MYIHVRMCKVFLDFFMFYNIILSLFFQDLNYVYVDASFFTVLFAFL